MKSGAGFWGSSLSDIHPLHANILLFLEGSKTAKYGDIKGFLTLMALLWFVINSHLIPPLILFMAPLSHSGIIFCQRELQAFIISSALEKKDDLFDILLLNNLVRQFPNFISSIITPFLLYPISFKHLSNT